MSKDEKLKELQRRHSKAIYHDYELTIIGETEICFVLSTLDGHAVSADKDVNIQFMLMKDVLGFSQVGRAEYQKEVSKFERDMQLRAIKLVTYKSWLLRVIEDIGDRYLAFISGTKLPADDGWYVHEESCCLKWLYKSEVSEIEGFIGYWGNPKT